MIPYKVTEQLMTNSNTHYILQDTLIDTHRKNSHEQPYTTHGDTKR